MVNVMSWKKKVLKLKWLQDPDKALENSDIREGVGYAAVKGRVCFCLRHSIPSSSTDVLKVVRCVFLKKKHNWENQK